MIEMTLAVSVSNAAIVIICARYTYLNTVMATPPMAEHRDGPTQPFGVGISHLDQYAAIMNSGLQQYAEVKVNEYLQYRGRVCGDFRITEDIRIVRLGILKYHQRSNRRTLEFVYTDVSLPY
jgi:hypothetical protein